MHVVLPATVRANKPQDLAAAHADRQTVQGDEFAIAFGELIGSTTTSDVDMN